MEGKQFDWARLDKHKFNLAPSSTNCSMMKRIQNHTFIFSVASLINKVSGGRIFSCIEMSPDTKITNSAIYVFPWQYIVHVTYENL